MKHALSNNSTYSAEEIEALNALLCVAGKVRINCNYSHWKLGFSKKGVFGTVSAYGDTLIDALANLVEIRFGHDLKEIFNLKKNTMRSTTHFNIGTVDDFDRKLSDEEITAMICLLGTLRHFDVIFLSGVCHIHYEHYYNTSSIESGSVESLSLYGGLYRLVTEIFGENFVAVADHFEVDHVPSTNAVMNETRYVSH